MTEFLVIAGVLVLGSLGLVFAPMLRGAGRGERRASFDMQVYRDQLREIESDRAQGRLSAEEAEATRAEVARRLIGAADAEAAEAGAATAPRRLSAVLALGLLLGVGVAAFGLYGTLGAPGYPDQPLALRLAGGGIDRAQRPGQGEAEAMAAAEGLLPPASTEPESLALVAQLQTILEGRPEDLEGHRLLARSLASLGRLAEARAAQARVLELMGEGAQGSDISDYAELMIVAAGGYVSPEAEAALAAALARDPEELRARYYSGLAALQGGRPDIAYPLWSRLIDDSPPDAPWLPVIEAEIDTIARLAGQPPRGPGRGEGEAAGEMDGEMDGVDRAAMIEGMVGRLAQRLASEGGPPEDWAQLIRSLAVLGRDEQARAIRDEAREVFAGEAGALALIEAAGEGLGP